MVKSQINDAFELLLLVLLGAALSIPWWIALYKSIKRERFGHFALHFFSCLSLIIVLVFFSGVLGGGKADTMDSAIGSMFRKVILLFVLPALMSFVWSVWLIFSYRKPDELK